MGLSLVIEQGPASPTEVADLVQRGHAGPTTMTVGLGANPPGTELMLRSFASWLIDDQAPARGWAETARLLQTLERSGNLEGAFVTAFGSSPVELETDWLAAVTGLE